MVGVAGWAWSTHAMVSASLLPVVEVRMFTHAHVSMITYRVDIYRSRPIGASLLTTSTQQGCIRLTSGRTARLPALVKIKNSLTFLVPAYPGCPGTEAVKRVSVLMYQLTPDSPEEWNIGPLCHHCDASTLHEHYYTTPMLTKWE